MRSAHLHRFRALRRPTLLLLLSASVVVACSTETETAATIPTTTASPASTAVAAPTSSVITVDSTTEQYFVLYAVPGNGATETPVSLTMGEAGTTDIIQAGTPLGDGQYRVETLSVAAPGDVDQDGIDDLTEAADPTMNPLNAAKSVDAVDGAIQITTTDQFAALSYSNTGVEEAGAADTDQTPPNCAASGDAPATTDPMCALLAEVQACGAAATTETSTAASTATAPATEAPESTQATSGQAAIDLAALCDQIPDNAEDIGGGDGGAPQFDPELAGKTYVKFIITDANTDHPKVYFMNTNTHHGHVDFAMATGLEGIGYGPNVIPGVMRGDIMYDAAATAPDGSTGRYRFAFQPRDAYGFAEVATAYEALVASAQVLAGKLAFYPYPDTGQPQYEADKPLYDAYRVPVILEA